MKNTFGWLVAMFTLKCPRCHKGKMFTYGNMYSWKKSDIMPEHCSCCGQSMEPEPGFYYGAMYLSYALYVMLFAPSFLVAVFFDIPFMEFFIVFVILIIAISPYIFRLARACYLYMFVKYDETAGKEIKPKV